MTGRWVTWGGIAVVAGVLGAPAGALAQLPISTFAGRQIGDGRAATAASLNRPFDVAFAPDGALLIADRLHHRIRRVDPSSGVITTLIGTVSGGGGNGMAADQAEMRDPLKIHVDPATGDILIAEFEGQVVRRFFAATGNVGGVAGSPDAPGDTGDGGPALNALLDGPADAVFDGAGGILIADRNNHKIRRVDPMNHIDTVVGTGTPGFLDGAAATAQLNFPACLLAIPGGGYFICDEQNHVIRRVDATGLLITTVAGIPGVPGFADGALLGQAQFNTPTNLAFADGTGNVLLLADLNNHRIRRIDLGAGTVTTIAGTGQGQFSPDGSPAATSPIFRPTSAVVAPDGRIVFGEDGSDRVRAIDAAGNLVTLAGDGVDTFGGDGGAAVNAQFGQVKSVARDADGNFLVSDSGNHRLRRVNVASGVVETIAGSGSPTFAGDGGPALEAGLTLSDAVQDASGNILISDTDNNRIRRVDPAGIITTVVGTGAPAFAGDGGPAVDAAINHPTGIELDAAGNLFIADFENNAIRRVDTAGNITTVAGVGGSAPGFNGDGIAATTATLGTPTDVAIDAAGNLYIADFLNHRVRFVDAATGMITTVAGTGVAGNDGDGGPAVAARLNNPSDVDIDETGAVWVTDFGNHRIRRFTPGGNIDAVAGTGLRGYSGDGGDALQARLLFPLRLLVLEPDSVLVADRDNFVVRLLGTIAFGCTGTDAATCVPGGGKSAPDCFTEFKMAATLPAGVPPPKISCRDGDPACDADATPGQCTFRIAACLNNEDPRLGCTPGGITSVKLTGKLAKSGGGQAVLAGLGALAPSSPLSKGRGVAFASAFTERNRCTPFADFVVPLKKKKGKGALGALTVTSASGKDKDKLKLFCLPPS